MTSIDESLLLKTAAEYGVPGPVARELMARTRPCLYLVPHEQVPAALREDARPAARTGGLPALPDGVDLPEPREPLVLSVDCAALPPDVLDIELPADGDLLLFTEIEYPPESSVVLHVRAGARTTERSATYESKESNESNGEAGHVRVYEPRTLYPVPGLTLDGDGEAGPRTRAFLDEDRADEGANDGAGAQDGAEDALDSFEEAVLDMAFGGQRPGVCVQLGGFSDSWDMAPDVGELVLLAQLAGQAIDYNVFTMNLIVGTREDIAARRFAGLQYDQQC
ncbi:DUF1963 domain-containing protein [Streptomyces phaeochromogenes]|uniref:DUF1963 domain-containing protein n=1 Tax=Streptomyces phaeochromogenes TaxID=1923 RepID=UPI0022585B12|nr:DUF1963 domain-containing protein [Streptomyces phaeochromogenes]MCX5601481.1 DUF1963 domain-containing protein [Streptomyces phaeochromogenes]